MVARFTIEPQRFALHRGIVAMGRIGSARQMRRTGHPRRGRFLAYTRHTNEAVFATGVIKLISSRFDGAIFAFFDGSRTRAGHRRSRVREPSAKTNQPISTLYAPKSGIVITRILGAFTTFGDALFTQPAFVITRSTEIPGRARRILRTSVTGFPERYAFVCNTNGAAGTTQVVQTSPSDSDGNDAHTLRTTQSLTVIAKRRVKLGTCFPFLRHCLTNRRTRITGSRAANALRTLEGAVTRFVFLNHSNERIEASGKRCIRQMFGETIQAGNTGNT
jgi:hypothetical protein